MVVEEFLGIRRPYGTCSRGRSARRQNLSQEQIPRGPDMHIAGSNFRTTTATKSVRSTIDKFAGESARRIRPREIGQDIGRRFSERDPMCGGRTENVSTWASGPLSVEENQPDATASGKNRRGRSLVAALPPALLENLRRNKSRALRDDCRRRIITSPTVRTQLARRDADAVIAGRQPSGRAGHRARTAPYRAARTNSRRGSSTVRPNPRRTRILRSDR